MSHILHLSYFDLSFHAVNSGLFVCLYLSVLLYLFFFLSVFCFSFSHFRVNKI